MTTLLLLLASPAFTPAAEDPSPAQLAAWVADLSGDNFDKQQAALKAFSAAGPKAKPAVPALVKLMEAKKRPSTDAIDALGAIGSGAKDAVPDLIKLATAAPTHSGFLLDHIAIALLRIDGAKPEATLALLLTPSKGHDISLLGSRYLREHAEKVVPQVVDLCGHKDEAVRAKAAQLLGELKSYRVDHKTSLFDAAGDGGKGIPGALEKLLADKSIAVCLAAATSIAKVAPQIAEKTIPVMIAAHLDGRLPPKAGVQEVVAIFQPVPDAAAKALIPLFDHKDASTRTWAIGVLSSLPAEKLLVAALRDDKSASTREAAAACLGSFHSTPQIAGPALTAALDDSEFTVRFAVGISLVRVYHGDIGKAAAAVPVLIEALKMDDDNIRMSAGQSLSDLGGHAKPAIPVLKPLLKHSKPRVAFEAALVLTEIDRTDAAEAVPVLIDNLGDEYDARRAARALAKIGPGAKAAAPALLKLFEAKDLFLRLVAIESAVSIDSNLSEKATASLVGILRDKQIKPGRLRDVVARVLIKIGPAAKAALPTLLEQLKDKGRYHADLALAAIAIDPKNAKPALDWIHEQVSTSGEEVDELVNLLSLMGTKAKPLIPEFLTLLKSESADFRESACTALGAIGPDAKEALPQLKELAANDPQPQTRKIAAAAIAKIER